MSEYQPRVFVKGDGTQVCTSPAREVNLRWAGWKAVGEETAQPATDQSSSTGTAEAAESPKRTRAKTPSE